MPLTHTPRNQGPDLLQHCWACPPADSPLWYLAGFCPIARFRVDVHSSDRPPGDTTTYAATPAGSAALAFSWLRYIQGKLRAANNPSWRFVGLFLQNWGYKNHTNAHSLLLHPDDDLAWTDNTPFTANGIAANLAWTTIFAEALAALLDASPDVYPPHILVWDHEERFLPSSWFPDDNTWTALLADERFGSETITPTFMVDGSPVVTFEDWLSKAVNTSNDPLNPSTANSYWHASNNHIRNFFYRFNFRVYAEALDQALIAPMRASFPDILACNWSIQPWLSALDVIPDKASNLLEEPGIPLDMPTSFDYATLNPYQRSRETFDTTNSFALFCRAYQVPETFDTPTDFKNLHLSLYKKQFASLEASGIPLFLWLPFTNSEETYTSTSIPGNPTFRETNERIFKSVHDAYSHGCRDMAHWMNTNASKFNWANNIALARQIATLSPTTPSPRQHSIKKGPQNTRT